MRSSDDSNDLESNLFLFKGDPTTRKTANLSSFPNLGLFDVDGKRASIKVASPDAKYQFEAYGPEDFSKFRKDIKDVKNNNPFKNGGTFCVDSLTSIVKMILTYSLGIKGSNAKPQAESKVGELTIANWDDYKAESAALNELISDLKTISLQGTKVILIAHVTSTSEVKVDGKNVVFRRLMTAAKEPSIYIPSQCQEIYHFYLKPSLEVSKPPRYIIKTRSTDIDYAASSFPWMPDEVDVTDGKLYQRMVELSKGVWK